MYRVAQQVMRGEHSWLENDIIKMIEDDDRPAASTAEPKGAFATVSS